MDTRTYKVLVERIGKETALLLLNEYYRNSKGHISSCEQAKADGGSYSLSRSGAKSLGVDSKYIMRGKVSSCPKEKGELPKLRTPFGVNTSTKGKQGGRMKMPSGEPKSPTHSVSKYPNKYKSIDELLGEDFLLTLEDTFGDFLDKRISRHEWLPQRKRWKEGDSEFEIT